MGFSFWDVGADIITGGMYSLTKTVCDANDDLKNVSDSVAQGITEITNKTVTLMGDADSLISETEKLINYPRVVPRNVDDLLPKEKEYYSDLCDSEISLVRQIEGLNINGQPCSTDNASLTTYIMLAEFAMMGQAIVIDPTLVGLAKQLLNVRDAKNNILLNEPGDIPDTLYQIQTGLDRMEKLVDVPRLESRGVEGLYVDEKKYFDKLQADIGVLETRFDQAGQSLDDSNIQYLIDQGKRAGATDDEITWGTWAQQWRDYTTAELDLLYDWPGPIPATLNDLQNVLAKFNADEQPRIDAVLDNINSTMADTRKVIQKVNMDEQPRIDALLTSLNDTTIETKAVLADVDLTVKQANVLLSDVDRSVESIQGGLDLVSKYKVPIMIFAGVTALIWFAISIMVLVVLIKIEFGPNPL